MSQLIRASFQYDKVRGSIQWMHKQMEQQVNKCLCLPSFLSFSRINKLKKKTKKTLHIFPLVKEDMVRSLSVPHCRIQYSQLFFHLYHPVESHLSSRKWWAQDGLVEAGIPSPQALPRPPWHRKDFVWSHPVILQGQD